MLCRSENIRLIAVLSLGWLATGRADAQLATSSPFIANKAANSSAPTVGAPLEFRGLIDTPDSGLKVRIYDPARKAGAWLGINEKDPNYEFVVKQYDASRDTATVEFRGQTLTLAQHEAKVTSSGMAPNIPIGGIPMPTNISPAVALNTSSATEQQRLEAVAAEVARRRQLREQAVQSSGQPVPVATPMIQQIPPQRAQPFQQNGNNTGRGQRGGRGRGQ